MREISLHIPAPEGADVARLTRHWRARLLDFGPGGPEVLEVDQQRGVIAVSFPGRDTAQVLEQLAAFGLRGAQQGERALFFLRPQVAFEDLDRAWGILFQALG